jgi:hypothetical protein
LELLVVAVSKELENMEGEYGDIHFQDLTSVLMQGKQGEHFVRITPPDVSLSGRNKTYISSTCFFSPSQRKISF